MKLPLVGQNYALRSPAAAVQQTMNLIPQFFDDPAEKGKNVGMLIGTPGYHSLNAPMTGLARGLWSGGGRCFGVAGVPGGATTLYELGLGTYQGGNPGSGSGQILSTNALPIGIEDGLPAQMFGDGNQLMIVKNGYAFVDNGPAPILIRLLISGTVNTVGTAVTWVSGDNFTSVMAGSYITIDGTNYLIASYNSPTSVTLTQSAGTQTGALYNAPAGDPLTAITGAQLDGYFIVQRPPAAAKGTVNVNGTAVTWVSGDQFSLLVNGQQITINGATYILSTVNSGTSLTLAVGAGVQNGVRYSGNIQTLTGVINTSGNTVTWVSGDQFDEIAPGQQITIVGLLYTVASVTPTTLTLTINIGTLTGVTYTAQVGFDPGRQFNISHPDDGTSWDPLDFASKEGYPDYLQCVLADEEQLYLLGTESLEVWQNTGNALFPFQRIQGVMKKRGNAARYGAVAMGGKVYFLSTEHGGPVAYRLDGFVPTRISTHAEEGAWSSGIDLPSAAVAYAEMHDGHHCWVINFPGSLLSWVYDETESERAGMPLWHQRATWSGAAFVPYVPRFHTFIPEWGPAGMHIVADYASGNWFESNLNYYDDNGGDKRWVRTLPHLYAGGKIQYFGRGTLEMETGPPSNTPVVPLITRDYSDDRGNTFSQPVTASVGATGLTSLRVAWPSNGSSRDRDFRYSGTGQYRTALIDLDMDIEVGLT